MGAEVVKASANSRCWVASVHANTAVSPRAGKVLGTDTVAVALRTNGSSKLCTWNVARAKLLALVIDHYGMLAVAEFRPIDLEDIAGVLVFARPTC